MRAMFAILKKELSWFFSSPTTYIMLAVFLGIAGFLFYNIASYFAVQCAQIIQYKASYSMSPPPMNANQWVVIPFFSNLAIIALFIIPILTMRIYSAERNSGTAELLLTSPISTTQIIWGKLLANIIVYTLFIGTTLIFQIILHIYTNPGLDWGPVWSGYLGLLLLGIAAIPLGQFISSLTGNQIISAFITFALLLLLWIVNWSTLFASPTIAQILNYIGFSQHFLSFSKGIIDTQDIIYFITISIFGIFLIHRSLNLWRVTGE
ncbi:ABC transporter permease [bacterium]|nr:MAG: ABC transporter permease [bacterium]